MDREGWQAFLGVVVGCFDALITAWIMYWLYGLFEMTRVGDFGQFLFVITGLLACASIGVASAGLFWHAWEVVETRLRRARYADR